MICVEGRDCLSFRKGLEMQEQRGKGWKVCGLGGSGEPSKSKAEILSERMTAEIKGNIESAFRPFERTVPGE